MKFLVNAPIIRSEKLPGDHGFITFEHAAFAKSCQPGQFLTIKTSDQYSPLFRRPFGVHDVDGPKISILFKIVGPGTKLLADKKTGETVDILGPLGNGFTLPETSFTTLLVAGGIGIAPFLHTAKLMMALGHPKPVLFYGGRQAQDLPRLDAFEKLGLTIFPATEDGSVGDKGFVSGPLEKYLEQNKDQDKTIFSCGPHPMLSAISDIAKKFDTTCQVSLENIMACGVGSCLGCVTDTFTCDSDSDQSCYERVCQEGPVFDSKKLSWR